MSLLDDELRALYALPPDKFVEARDAMAKELTREKRREEARELKALKRPSPAIWGLNAVSREAPEHVAELDRAAVLLAAAQRGDAHLPFREAAQAHRAAMARVVEAMPPVFARAGVSFSPAVAERAEAILRRVSLEAWARAALAKGLLVEPSDEPSFEELAGGLVAGAPAAAASELAAELSSASALLSLDAPTQAVAPASVEPSIALDPTASRPREPASDRARLEEELEALRLELTLAREAVERATARLEALEAELRRSDE